MIKNIAKSVINYRNHKIVFRASGSIFCDYVYAFINDDPKPGLPFYMLNRNEIPKYYDEFIERLGIDKNREIITEKMIAEITKFFKKLYSVQYWGSSLNRIFQDGLRALYEKDEATPNELSGKLALNSSTLTGILDRLEKKGLLKRELNSKDRRSIIVKLTEKAKTLKDGLWKAYETVNGEFLSVLSKEEHKTLLNVLGRLENRSQEMHKEEMVKDHKEKTIIDVVDHKANSKKKLSISLVLLQLLRVVEDLVSQLL
jgi:DNA-binding MarR family transcriptional regulator